LKQAPFNKRDAQLVPAAGSCVDCPKRTGNNKLLFAEWASDSESQCTDPNCYAVKVEAFLQKQIATKPELVQISTAYGQQQEGSKIITRSKYVEIKSEKPDTPEKAKWPEFKTCKYTTEAIVSEGIDKGQLRNVCTQPDCTIHHPKKQSTKADASFKAEQDKSRREQALANATGIRVLQTIVAAVPVRLMKRDFLFIAEQMLPLLDDKRLEMVARNQGIRAKEGESAAKLLTAFLRKAEEGVIGKVIVETVILLSASKQADGGKVLRAAAQAYKVDTDAIALKVKHEFAAKEKARSAAKIEPKPVPKALKKIA
jgi:ParB family chromosome partitioning protein